MRGIIFTDDIQSIKNNRTRLQSGLNPERLKNSLLFWDEICYISTPLLNLPINEAEDYTKELVILQQEKILRNILCLTKSQVNDAEQGKIKVPSFFLQENLFVSNYEPILIDGEIEGVGLFKTGNILEVGNGLKIGSEQMRVKEIYTNILMQPAILSQQLNKKNDGFWSIGQTGFNFEMPLIPGLSEENQLLELNFHNILPFPTSDTPIEKILRFKEKYCNELIIFQLALSKLNSKIENSQGDPRVIQDCKDEIKIALINLHRTLDESKIKKTFGVVKTLLDVKQIGSASIIAGAVAYLAEVPIIIGALTGYAVSGAISLLSKKEKKIEKLDSSNKDYAYLYYAEKEFKN
jgi:hypothetical protein